MFESPPTDSPHPASNWKSWSSRALIAALVSGAFSLAGNVWELAPGDQDESTLGSILALAGILPLIVVVIGFMQVADAFKIGPVFNLKGERNPDPVRRACICLFASLGWIVALSVVVELFPDADDTVLMWALIVTAVYCVVLLGYATDGSYMLPILFVVYFGTKYGIGRGLLGLRLTPGESFAVTGGVFFFLSVYAYTIWFGITLLRSRVRFGSAGIPLGIVLLAGLAALTGWLAWFGVSLANLPQVEMMGEKEFEDVFSSHYLTLIVISIIGDIAFTLATAWFFWRVREREPVKVGESTGAGCE